MNTSASASAELQKCANRANLLVLVFPAGANNAKNCVHFTFGTGSHHCKLYNLQCVSSTGATKHVAGSTVVGSTGASTSATTNVLLAPVLVAHCF